MRRHPHRFWVILALTALISACGGGGGGGGGSNSSDDAVATPTPPETPPAPPTQTFTLSGIISTSVSQTVDSDTNDPARPAVSNDLPTIAQRIPNPVTLGGYINRPGTGAPGRSRIGGDIDDFFLVDLLAGQRVTMLVGDFLTADADLYLFDLRGNLVDFSIEQGEVESIVIPEDGTYFVNAFAFAGGTNYILAIGSSSIPAAQQLQNYDIVPWEAIVTYHDDDGGPDIQQQALMDDMGMEPRAGSSYRSRLLALRNARTTQLQRERRLGAARAKAAAIKNPDALARWETLMTVKSLRQNPRVRSARPNYLMQTFATPNDEAFPLQWHYPLVGLPAAWDFTTGNSDVVVAVIDTGVLSAHPDLAGNLVPGYDFVRDAISAGDGNGIDPNPEDPGNSVGGGGDSFHGTHVSGTVAALGNNNVGGTGSAYGASLMPLRVFGTNGGATAYDVEQAIRFAAGLPNDSGTVPEQRADIINLSLGGAPFEQDTQDLLREVRAAGVTVVAAAGNSASSAPVYPAAYDGVISVSAVDTQRQLARYSNTGPRIDVAAPGGDGSVDLNGDGFPDGVLSTSATIESNTLNFGYTFLTGTSMAAPHVAGILALAKSVNPTLTPQDFDSLLASGELTDDIGAPGRDDLYGHGLINAQRTVFAALEATGASPADNPRLVASANTLNFGSVISTLELNLQNAGKGDLALANVESSEPWLSVTPLEVDSQGLGNYQVSVDRSGLTPGLFSANITAQSSVNSVTVQVLASQAIGEGDTDLGVIYILLFDPQTNETISQFVSVGDDSVRSFRFTNVAPGRYELVAGTDTDNDISICDAGEACGSWLTIDQPILLEPDSDLSGLDFPVEYLVSLPTISSSNTERESAGIRRLEVEPADK